MVQKLKSLFLLSLFGLSFVFSSQAMRSAEFEQDSVVLTYEQQTRIEQDAQLLANVSYKILLDKISDKIRSFSNLIKYFVDDKDWILDLFKQVIKKSLFIKVQKDGDLFYSLLKNENERQRVILSFLGILNFIENDEFESFLESCEDEIVRSLKESFDTELKKMAPVSWSQKLFKLKDLAVRYADRGLGVARNGLSLIWYGSAAVGGTTAVCYSRKEPGNVVWVAGSCAVVMLASFISDKILKKLQAKCRTEKKFKIVQIGERGFVLEEKKR